jgi:hypothetical protein
MPFASNVERTEAVRLVVDTNLMIRALRTPGPARQFFKLAPLTHLLVYHPEQIQELRDVASRPKLAIAPPAVDELIDRVRRYAQSSNPNSICPVIAATQRIITFSPWLSRVPQRLS